MNQENRDEMRPEYDIRGGVRGKYLARYQRWACLTSAEGPVSLLEVLSTSDTPKAGITLTHQQTYQVIAGAPHHSVGPHVASEVSTFAAHAG